MSNFELIDDYLTNQLDEQAKLEFEKQLGSDPALKADVELQKNIIEGVRKARISELKAMLNNVPIGSGLGTAAAGKIAAAVITAGIVGTSLYFYFTPGSPELPQTQSTQEIKEPPSNTGIRTDSTTSEKKEDLTPVSATPKTTPSLTKQGSTPETGKPAIATKPTIHAADPSDVMVEDASAPVNPTVSGKASVTLSQITVDINNSNKKYNFHYQFKDGKLALYGMFDKSLYEILEIHGDRHAVFLFYKDSYYLLNEKKTQITPLEPIRDGLLIKKLKEYQGR